MRRVLVWGGIVCLGWATARGQDGTGNEGQAADSDTTVVTATRVETDRKDVGSSISVIDVDRLRQRGSAVVTELLKSIPGVDVRTSGAPGAQTSIFLRGTESNHTKVLLDGIDTADPSTPGGISQMEFMLTNGVGRVEVLRGPQSALYGSDAIGGVISLQTPRGTGDPTAYLATEFGSHRTWINRFGTQGAVEDVNFSAFLAHVDTRGISARDTNDEPDPYRNTTFNTRFGIAPSEDFEVNFYLHRIDAANEFDGFGSIDTDSTSSDRTFAKVEPVVFLSDQWTATFELAYTDHERETDEGASSALYRGTLFKLGWQNEIELGDAHRVVAGVEYLEEDGKREAAFNPFDEKRDNTAVYLQDQIRLAKAWTVTPGVRADDDSVFGTQTTYRVATAYREPPLGRTWRGSVGTGFNAPALDDLYGFAGSTALKPEETFGFDVGVEQQIDGDRAVVGVTYFNNKIENLIASVDTGGFVFENFNIEDARAQGVEVEGRLRPQENVDLRAAYTYTDTRAGNTVAFSSLAPANGARLLRRPLHKFSVDAAHRFLDDRAEVSAGVLYVGKRDDAGNTTLGSYATAYLTGSLEVADGLRLLGRVENLFDTDYQDVDGFNAPGRVLFVGARYDF